MTKFTHDAATVWACGFRVQCPRCHAPSLMARKFVTHKKVPFKWVHDGLTLDTREGVSIYFECSHCHKDADADAWFEMTIFQSHPDATFLTWRIPIETEIAA